MKMKMNSIFEETKKDEKEAVLCGGEYRGL